MKAMQEETELDAEVAVCANFTALDKLNQEFAKAGAPVRVGAQNVHFENEGAFTGEVSIAMLKDIEIDLVIIGHSERRQYFGETDETVNKKLRAVFAEGLTPIVCVGENLETRERGEEKTFVKAQLEKGLAGLLKEDVEKLVVAYEPIWAIGTGKTATEEQAEEMCAFIRQEVASIFGDDAAASMRIQYGGSVKPENAKKLFSMPNIDGGLVGGASLKAGSFIEIVRGAN
jgi:triosephosphate isomerase